MSKSVNPVIQNDIMRYKKNKFGANLALLGLVFGCIYFIVLYAQVKNGDYYYKWSIAFDVIYNLVFLLITFLCSEQVKNYNRKLFWLQLVVGAIQIARIFWLPLGGMTAGAITSGTFIAMIIGLAGSGAFIIASAIIGFIRSKSVEHFKKQLESGEVSVEATLLELEKEDELKAQATANLVNKNEVVDNQISVDNKEINGVEAEILPETNDQEVK